MKQGRASGVKLLSVQDLEQQLASPGATWLDRAQVSWGRGGLLGGISSKSSKFANEMDTAFQRRRTWLIERGYAELHQDEQKNSIIFKRGYLKALETEGFNAATEKLSVAVSPNRTLAQRLTLSDFETLMDVRSYGMISTRHRKQKQVSIR